MATAPAHRDEARPVAHNIAKLPVLVRRAQPPQRARANTSASHPTPDISLHRTNRCNGRIADITDTPLSPPISPSPLVRVLDFREKGSLRRA